MDMPTISTIEDLAGYFGKKDKNVNGKLERDELADVPARQFKSRDRNRDNVLEPWEVVYWSFPISQRQDLSDYNRMRGAFPSIETKKEVVIRGVRYAGGTTLDFYLNGRVRLAQIVADTKFGQYIFRNGSTMEFHENGKLMGGVFLGETRLGGVKIKAGSTFELWEDGRLRSGILAEDTRVGGLVFQAGSKLMFYQNGDLYEGILAVDCKYDGILYKAGKKICFHEIWGKVSEGWITGENTIYGVTFKGDSYIGFSGVAKTCTVRLAGDTGVYGITFKKGTVFEFSVTSGDLNRVFTENDMEIKGITYQAKINIRFYPNGQIEFGALAADAVIQGVDFTRGTRVEFYENGKLKGARLSEETRAKKISLAAGSDLGFYESGKLKSGELAKDASFRGVRLKAGTKFSLYENGGLEWAYLSEETVIQGEKFDGMTPVWFDQSGRVRKERPRATRHLRRPISDD